MYSPRPEGCGSAVITSAVKSACPGVCARVAEAYEYGAAAAFHLDGELGALVVEVLVDHLADLLHEVQGALLAGP
ncbi:hypothetical protein ACFYZ8_09760 [Streptomyces sp. NPDC001668]|uniref:hypothetical protein n=1 Tax=unclassified Streptomyces TaxID=2593676 RepID=UPI0036803727